jgi:hypothetical protein
MNIKRKSIDIHFLLGTQQGKKKEQSQAVFSLGLLGIILYALKPYFHSCGKILQRKMT